MLSTEDTPRTTAERYISAGNTSDLTVDTRQQDARNTADVILAAGAALVKRTKENMVQHQKRTADLRLGELLLKVRGEFDGAVRLLSRAAAPTAEPAQRIREADATYAERLAVHRCQRALQHQRETERQNFSERLLMLNSLPSLGALKERATAWLEERRLPVSIAQGVIFYWLDPVCTTCKGRRWKVANGTGRLTSQGCPVCMVNGTPTGERRLPPGQAAGWLYDHLQRAAGEFPPAAQRKMR